MFDIFLLNKNWDKAKKAIESVISSKSFEAGLVRLHIFDFDGDAEKEKAYQKENVICYDASELTDASVCNKALSLAQGDLLTFMNDSMIYTAGAIEKVIETADKGADIISLNLLNVLNERPRTGLLFEPVFDREGKMEISLTETPFNYHIFFWGYSFKTALFKGMAFDESLDFEWEHKMLLDLLDREGRYTLLKEEIQYTCHDERNFFGYPPQFDKDWYTKTMREYLAKAAPEGSSSFRQRLVLYLIGSRYCCNLNDRDKSVLRPDEVQEFVKATREAVQTIEDKYITDYKDNNIAKYPQSFGLNLLRIKYDDPSIMPEIICDDDGFKAVYNEGVLWKPEDMIVDFRVTYFDGENLTMDGSFTGAFAFEEGEIEIIAVLDGKKEYPVRRNHIYSLTKIFAIPTAVNYTFQFSIPEAEVHHGMTFRFYLVYKERKYPLVATFKRAQAKLGGFPHSYWVFNQHILSYKEDKNTFLIEDLKRFRLFRHEAAFLKDMILVSDEKTKYKMAAFRCAYWLQKSKYKKKIWLTQDKIFKAGDNGEYMFRYIMAHKPEDVDMYYVVSKSSPDYKRLKKEYDNIIEFNSLQHKMLAMHCDLMLATHVDTLTCNGIMHSSHKYFKDIYNAKTVCLAHGLTIQQIAQYQSRTFDNTVLYFFASKYEVKNCQHDAYDYYDPEMLKLTGHARYDGLVSNDQRIILITPTWRRGTTTGTAHKGKAYEHSDSFKNSEYYKIYNGLISDERLLESAKKNNYRVVFLLHPAMSAQLKDYDAKEGVEIIAATSDISYEKILTESSLMVTDYSGVQFDFAFMKKPLVYYHPDTLPPQYESSGLNYETMGFGPICKNHEQIIEKLCFYMDRQCQMEDMYKDRVDDFFQYSDHNNCERITEEIIKFQNKFDKVTKMHYK